MSHLQDRTQGRWGYGYGRLRTLVFRMLGCTARENWRTYDWVWDEQENLSFKCARFSILRIINLNFLLPRAYPPRALTPCMSSPSAYRSSSQINNTSGSGRLHQLRDSAWVHLPPLPPTPTILPTASICRLPFRESTILLLYVLPTLRTRKRMRGPLYLSDRFGWTGTKSDAIMMPSFIPNWSGHRSSSYTLIGHGVYVPMEIPTLCSQ